MKAIEIYLVTNGDGLKAVDFYKEAFNAELVNCMTFGQAMPDTPEAFKDYVINAQLNINGIRLQLSDNNPEFEYVYGTNMTACLQFETIEEAKAVYDKLIVNAKKVDMEFQEVPWSPGYAVLVDQFGMNWQVNTDIEGFVSETVKF